MPLRIYSISLAPPRSPTMQHLKQELRYTQTDKATTKCIYLGINLIFFAEFLYNCGRETFVRDGSVEFLQIANRGTDGRNTFRDDVLLSNTDTNMLVNPISKRNFQARSFGVIFFLQSLMKKTLNVAAYFNPKD